MPHYFFRWTEESEEHLAQHGITRAEFEEVVMSPVKVSVSRTSSCQIAFGDTSTGKYIACLYDEYFDTVYPATAFEIEL